MTINDSYILFFGITCGIAEVITNGITYGIVITLCIPNSKENRLQMR